MPGQNGGFNPFRDGHGRFADRPGGGGGSRETLSAPLPAKTEWSQGGVSVEFSGGKTPSYRVMHRDQMIKEFPATTKWRQDLAAATQHAAAHLSTLQAAEMTARIRTQAAAAAAPAAVPAAPEIAVLRDLAAGARVRATPEAYQTVGKAVLDQARLDPEAAAALARLAELKALAKGMTNAEWKRSLVDVGTKWRQDLPTATANAQVAANRHLHRAALEVVGRVRPLAEASDFNLIRGGYSRGTDLVAEVAGAFPRDWATTAARSGQLRIAEDHDGRSNYDTFYRTINFHKNAWATTMAHELGHYFENNVPGLRKAATAYRDQRAAGSPLQSLRAFSSAYGQDEVTKPDKFADPYIGKIYRDGDTEVCAMMSGAMGDRTADLAGKDPQMFAWWLGVLVSL